MKQQIIFSPDTEKGSGSTEPVKRLANRYGIPEKDVEALLYGSRAPKSEASGSDTKGKPMADDFRPNYPVQPPRERGWSPVNVLSAIVGILGILALTIILVNVLRRPRFDHMSGFMMPPPRMEPQNAPHPAMMDTTSSTPKETSSNDKPDDIPPPASSNAIDSKAAPVKHHSTASHHSAGFSTTNSMEAQEHLAEMRADGNTKARIHSSSKNGVTIYNVK